MHKGARAPVGSLRRIRKFSTAAAARGLRPRLSRTIRRPCVGRAPGSPCLPIGRATGDRPSCGRSRSRAGRYRWTRRWRRRAFSRGGRFSPFGAHEAAAGREARSCVCAPGEDLRQPVIARGRCGREIATAAIALRAAVARAARDDHAEAGKGADRKDDLSSLRHDFRPCFRHRSCSVRAIHGSGGRLRGRVSPGGRASLQRHVRCRHAVALAGLPGMELPSGLPFPRYRFETQRWARFRPLGGGGPDGQRLRIGPSSSAISSPK